MRRGSPLSTRPEVSPVPDEPADVLAVVSRRPHWVDYRGRARAKWCASRGVRWAWTHSLDPDRLEAEVRARSVTVVVVDTWLVRPVPLSRLASRNPSVRWVVLTHGSPAYVASLWPHLHYAYLELAAEVGNCYYGLVTAPNTLVAQPEAKVVHLPNMVEPLPEGLRRPTTPTDSIKVGIVSRTQEIKGVGASVMAVAALRDLLADRMAVECFLTLHGSEEFTNAHRRGLENFGIPHTFRPWFATRDEVLKAMSDEGVQLSFQLSFTDSLNMAGVEHCWAGIPVVGSTALDWLPKAWQTNTQEPRSGAAAAAKIVRDYKASSAKAIDTASKLTRRLETTLEKNLLTLLS